MSVPIGPWSNIQAGCAAVRESMRRQIQSQALHGMARALHDGSTAHGGGIEETSTIRDQMAVQLAVCEAGRIQSVLAGKKVGGKVRFLGTCARERRRKT